MKCSEFAVKYAPVMGETLIVIFSNGDRREIETLPGDAAHCWEEEFSVQMDNIREAYIEYDDGGRDWYCGGPGNLRPREQIKIINNHHIYVGGTWFEIAADDEGVIDSGNCDDNMSPRQIYTYYFGKIKQDGVWHQDVTVFLGDPMTDELIHMTDKRVMLDVFDYNSDYKTHYNRHNKECRECWRDMIPHGHDRRREGYLLFYDPHYACTRPLIWTERPRVLVVQEPHFTLPYQVLKNKVGYMTEDKYFAIYDKLNAIAKYLDEAGQKYFWL